jgi:hypothetical protein
MSWTLFVVAQILAGGIYILLTDSALRKAGISTESTISQKAFTGAVLEHGQNFIIVVIITILNAEAEPEVPDYPKDPEFRIKYGPRGVLDYKATDKDGPGNCRRVREVL